MYKYNSVFHTSHIIVHSTLYPCTYPVCVRTCYVCLLCMYYVHMYIVHLYYVYKYEVRGTTYYVLCSCRTPTAHDSLLNRRDSAQWSQNRSIKREGCARGNAGSMHMMKAVGVLNLGRQKIKNDHDVPFMNKNVQRETRLCSLGHHFPASEGNICRATPLCGKRCVPLHLLWLSPVQSQQSACLYLYPLWYV